MIRQLPEYLIDRLKKGEVIERPVSVIKELIENSLDAGATKIQIGIQDGGKSIINVEDDGSGIELSDMDMLFKGYATSKIHGEQDLFNLKSYGFRGEALSEIAKISKMTIISKTGYSEIGTKITKLGMDSILKHQPVGFMHGTITTVQDLFYNEPEKAKSLKSSQTEFFYCYNYMVDIAIVHYGKTFVFKKNDKVIFDLQPRNSLMERITDIYKKDRSKSVKYINHQSEDISFHGIVGDTKLIFGSAENIKIYINKRPVQDKIITKALMDAYAGKLSLNEYPLAVLVIDMKPNFIDILMDSKKSEVRFIDSRKVYDVVFSTLQQALGETGNPTMRQQFSRLEISYSPVSESKSIFEVQDTSKIQSDMQQAIMASSHEPKKLRHKQIGEYGIIGQLRNSYILLENKDTLYCVDQYRLAEKILFEKIRSSLHQLHGPSSEILLQPIMIGITDIPDIDQKLDEINALGFDASRLGENKIAIYSIPQAFSVYKVDMEKVFMAILREETITFDTILGNIFTTHACKVLIKTGDKLSLKEMSDLIQDGLTTIANLLVGTNNKIFTKIEKENFEKSFG